MNMLVKMASDDEVKELRSQFQELDKDGSGMILATELADVISKQPQLNISDAEIQDIIKEIDYHGNQKINYSEFLSATINIKTFLNDSKLRAIFSQFNTDGSDTITEENIYYAFQKLGQEIKREEIREMIKKHDIEHTGDLDYEEFKAIFQDI